MPKIDSLQELIIVRVLNLDLHQLERTAMAVSCIEAGEIAAGDKVLKLITENETLRATNELLENRCCNLEMELSAIKKEERMVEKLKQKLKSSTTTLGKSTKQIHALLKEKEELEFAVSSLQQTILKLRGSKAA